MIRWVISFPNRDMDRREFDEIRDAIQAAVTDAEKRDVIISHGGTIRRFDRPTYRRKAVVYA